MDQHRFDQLVRGHRGIHARRGLLAGLASGLLAVASLRLAPFGAAARKRKRKRPRRRGGRCAAGTRRCGGRCIPAAACCTDANCPAGSSQSCQNGSCACPAGQRDSGGVCGMPPVCLSVGLLCATNADCCSDFCTLFGGRFTCVRSGEPGRACHTDLDCNGDEHCRGFVCTG